MTRPSDVRTDRPARSAVSEFRLHDEIERLKREPGWASGSRNAITLTKGPFRLVLVVLKRGTKLEEHHARGPMSLQVVSGLVRFQAGDSAIELGAGQLVVLESALAHDVEALGESALLLTLAA